MSDLRNFHDSLETNTYKNGIVRYSHENSYSSSENDFRDSWSGRDHFEAWKTDEGKRGGREDEEDRKRSDEGKRGDYEDYGERKRNNAERIPKKERPDSKRVRKTPTKIAQSRTGKVSHQQRKQLPQGIDLDDLLEEDGAASAMMATATTSMLEQSQNIR